MCSLAQLSAAGHDHDVCSLAQLSAAGHDHDVCSPAQLSAAGQAHDVCSPAHLSATGHGHDHDVCSPAQLSAADHDHDVCSPAQLSAAGHDHDVCSPAQLSAAGHVEKQEKEGLDLRGTQHNAWMGSKGVSLCSGTFDQPLWAGSRFSIDQKPVENSFRVCKVSRFKRARSRATPFGQRS